MENDTTGSRSMNFRIKRPMLNAMIELRSGACPVCWKKTLWEE